MVAIRGGQKFEAALRDLAGKIAKPATLRVGFLENSTDRNGVSNPMKAAINEYGAPAVGIPPRPFFRNMIAAKKAGWPKAIATALAASDNDAVAALNLTGDGIKGQLQQSIRDLWTPPLAESTIRRKGFDKPLIDTGDMVNSVTWDVKS